MNNTGNSLIEGLERLGLIASRIRQNQGEIPQIEIDIILQELRNLYMVALQLDQQGHLADSVNKVASQVEAVAAAKKAAEEKRLAEEAAAKKAAEEKRLAEEAAAKKAAEEKRLAEEAAAKKAAEERRLAEEAAAKKAAEERRLAEEAAEERRLAEEAAAKKAAEEKRLAEEAAAKKAAEEKRLAEEAAAKKAAEEKRLAEAEMQKPVFAQEPSAKEAAPIMEPTIDKLEGNPNDELFTDGPAKPEAPKQKEGSLFDYLSAEKQGTPAVRTLADKLNQHSRNVEEALENSVNARKVDDLRTIININDKFSFMSDLFHNNMKAYSDFILNLNAYTDREEALAYVAEVAQQYQWDSKPSVVESFYRIFDRKF
ncbi:MAG: hypothetical protein MJZ45_04090 [Bacteroidales bacterium]|nr:hypothetical protein [Bacteroidales bacterium]